MQSEGEFKTILIMGLGLMGGSLLKVLQLVASESMLLGFDQCVDTVLKARTIGLAHQTEFQLDNLPVEQCDLVVLATPIGAYDLLMEQIKGRLKPGAVVMDLGSVKNRPGTIIAQKLIDTEVHYIGGHPMNGSDQSGLGAAHATLYQNAWFFLTTNWNTKPGGELQLQRVESWVKKLGAMPLVVDAEQHDAITAKTSHMPHLAASLLISGITDFGTTPRGLEQMKRFMAGGFRDTTRVAGSNSNLWTDVFLSNKASVLSELDNYIERLLAFKDALQKNERQWIHDLLMQNAKIRNELEHNPTNT